MKQSNFFTAKWMSAMLASALLAGCSLLPENTDGLTLETAQVQESSQKVRWHDSDTKWLNWDLGHPNNQLVEWVYENDAIILNIDASSELNVFSQRSHTLVMKVVQLSDTSGISSLLQTSGGIANVLSQEIGMIPGAVYQDSYLIAPNQKLAYKTARQENTKYLAIVTGYAELNASLSTRLMPIPVMTIVAEQAERSLFDTITFGLFEEEQEEIPDLIRPSVVELDVVLGANSITAVNASAK